jgi:RHS repeat-associated protein
VVLRYIYDGSQLATIDSAGTTIQTFTFYPGSETPHSVLRSGGNRQYYLTEIGAGSVWGIHDSTAAVKNHYRYAPFGLLEDSSEVVKNPLRFTGREYDPETRLYFNRARYYDPELARFISEDPIGQNGGLNQYAYVMNDPVNATDPLGTDCISDRTSYQDGAPCSGGRGGGRGVNTLGYAGADINDPWAGLNSGDDNQQGAYDCRKSGNNWDCTAMDPSTEDHALEDDANEIMALCGITDACATPESERAFSDLVQGGPALFRVWPYSGLQGCPPGPYHLRQNGSFGPFRLPVRYDSKFTADGPKLFNFDAFTYLRHYQANVQVQSIFGVHNYVASGDINCDDGSGLMVGS